jgi:hypothetical protein
MICFVLFSLILRQSFLSFGLRFNNSTVSANEQFLWFTKLLSRNHRNLSVKISKTGKPSYSSFAKDLKIISLFFFLLVNDTD